MTSLKKLVFSYENNFSTFLIYNDKSYSYNDLFIEFSKWDETLKNNLVLNKVVTCIGDFSPSGIALMLALIINNNIFVPTTNDSKILTEILSISQSSFLINIATKDITKIFPNQPSNSLILELIDKRKNPGLILFSSGSTGVPKAAIHDFTPLIEKYTLPQNLKKITSLAFLLFDHIGGINTVLYNLFSKGILVIPSHRSSDYILSLIEKFNVELLPTTPSFLNLLLLNKSYLNFNLSSLKTISYGTEPMPLSTLQALNKAFPNILFKQT
jgi:acyl-coenzyme A synthetase/AMP-(fatty) acid ligase